MAQQISITCHKLKNLIRLKDLPLVLLLLMHRERNLTYIRSRFLTEANNLQSIIIYSISIII